MRPIDIYECKPGYVVMTGDSYGLDLCIALRELPVGHEENQYSFQVIEFLDLQNFTKHQSGGQYGYTDDCYLIAKFNLELFLQNMDRYLNERLV